MVRLLALVILCLLSTVVFAFLFPSSTLPYPSSSSTMHNKRTSKTLTPSSSLPSLLLRHAAADSDDDDEKKKAPAPRDMPPPSPLSDNMRQKLLNEARATGADYNSSNGNPILIVAAVIGVLVILGGKGFFF
ncbi:hypothetical protein VYU27_009603 [Nannochloropsis oceanica]